MAGELIEDTIDQQASAFVLARFDGPRRAYLSAAAHGSSLMRTWDLNCARLFTSPEAFDRWAERVPVESRVQLAGFALVEIALAEIEAVRPKALDGLALEAAEEELAELERWRADRRSARKVMKGKPLEEINDGEAV